MPQYKIFIVEPMGFPAVPVIVTTAYANAGGYPRAEWFLAIPDEQDSFFAQRIKYDVRKFPAGPYTLDEDVLLVEALDEAKLRLRRYFYERREQDGQVFGFRSPDIKEDNKNLFMYYWIRGECGNQIKKIHDTTELEQLREDIHQVLQLPKSSHNDL